MRATVPTLLALSALGSAQQIPLLDQAKTWFNSLTGAVSNPVTAAGSSIASSQVHVMDKSNWRSLLSPGSTSSSASSPGSVDEWMIYATGGNKSCAGRCGPANDAWVRAVPLISATKGAPNLASLDCEQHLPLCYAWNANPPSVLHVRIPHPSAGAQQTPAPAEFRRLYFSVNETKPNDIAKFVRPEEYTQVEPYVGFFHPLNGFGATSGLNLVAGHVIWVFNILPSWVTMIAISFASRSMMSRRTQPTPRRPGQPGAAAAPAGN